MKTRKLIDENPPWFTRRRGSIRGVWSVGADETFSDGRVWVWCVDGTLYRSYKSKEHMFNSKFWKKWFPGGEAPVRLSTRCKENCIFGKFYFTQDPLFVVPRPNELKKFTHDPLALKYSSHKHSLAFVQVKQSVWRPIIRAVYDDAYRSWANKCWLLEYRITKENNPALKLELTTLLDNQPGPMRIIEWHLNKSDIVSASVINLHEHFADTEGSVLY